LSVHLFADILFRSLFLHALIEAIQLVRLNPHFRPYEHNHQ